MIFQERDLMHDNMIGTAEKKVDGTMDWGILAVNNNNQSLISNGN